MSGLQARPLATYKIKWSQSLSGSLILSLLYTEFCVVLGLIQPTRLEIGIIKINNPAGADLLYIWLESCDTSIVSPTY